jgi:hypothetical protein
LAGGLLSCSSILHGAAPHYHIAPFPNNKIWPNAATRPGVALRNAAAIMPQLKLFIFIIFFFFFFFFGYTDLSYRIYDIFIHANRIQMFKIKTNTTQKY